MIVFFNKHKSGLFWVYVLLVLLTGTSTSCEKDKLDIVNKFPFEVMVMPVPKEVANEESVEIRITIESTGNYNNTEYFIRYFQFDGHGTLQYYKDPPYIPNDVYSLPMEQFRLYYTSTSSNSQSFEVWISDNFGNEKQLSFKFNSSD